jgi:hypothetical protein
MRIPTNPPLFVNYSVGWYKILEMTMGSSHHNNWYAIAPSPTHPTKTIVYYSRRVGWSDWICIQSNDIRLIPYQKRAFLPTHHYL